MKISERIESFLIRKIGRLSTGIDLSFRHGFTSGILMDYIYKNTAHGKNLLGKLLDRIFLSNIGWKAVRERKIHLANYILRTINRSNGPFNLVDMACGPGTYLIEAISNLNARENIHVICQDVNVASLDNIRSRFLQTGIKRVTFSKKSFLEQQSLTDQSLVIIAGVYEWLIDDEDVKHSMKIAASILKSGGYFLFSHLSGHKKLQLVESTFVDAGYNLIQLKVRSKSVVAEWAESYGFKIIEQIQDEWGLHTVSYCQKI